MERKVYTNKQRDALNISPYFTIITPAYNRAHTVSRTIKSVENQMFKDFEYIIIDDGSTDNIDDIIFSFMDNTVIPVTYVKKSNGGVHTARNVGIDLAIGQYIIFLDSDDELVSNACEIFYREWNKIPTKKRELYFQVKALSVDENGNHQGKFFPNNINEKPYKETMNLFCGNGEKMGCYSAKIMKENKCPEPKGVTFLYESNLWLPLQHRYLSWGSNEIVQQYHREGDDHLSKNRKTDLQFYKNELWQIIYRCNQPKYFRYTFKWRKYYIERYYKFYRIIKKEDKEFVKLYKFKRIEDKLLLIIRKCFYNSKHMLKRIFKKQ